MKQNQASQTALGTAALRALESEKPAADRICYDPLARKLVDPGFYLQVRLFARLSDWFTRGGSTFVVCRARYIDDYLLECLSAGIGQVVILGAGMDSRAYRGDLLPMGIKTFEVDHPATQAVKVEKIRYILGEMPKNVVYLPLDFSHETLDKLLSAGFDQSLKTLFIWEGVSLYLDEEKIGATLLWVLQHAAPGSAIVFDYQDTSTLVQRNVAYALLNRLTGERRVFGMEKDHMAAFLAQKGFTHIVDVGPEQLKRLYCTGHNQHRLLANYYSIVHANVGD